MNLPPLDLVLCKDVLQHWPQDDILVGLDRLAQSARFVLLTNSVAANGLTTNSEIPVGGFSPLNLLSTPYSIKPVLWTAYSVPKVAEPDIKLCLLWDTPN